MDENGDENNQKESKSVIRDRLEEGLDPLALKFTSSIEHDRFIFNYDILVDVAHVLTLHKSGYLNVEEVRDVIGALKKVAAMEIDKLKKYEDIHEAIENEVTKISDAGLKMHTGRSRNDEVATCLRMFARDHLLILMEKIVKLLERIITLAEKSHFPMPGFTHLQFAQPTRLSHHLIAYFDALSRDLERCCDAFERTNLSPLGSAAFTTSGYGLDRRFAAELLGFRDVAENSEDAIASRDFLIESIFVSTSTMLSISRIAEEIVLWSSEFDFVELPDRYSSVSSIMPQKKNPDVAELLRANAGKMVGNLMAVMAIYKAMPYSYNRDFQEMNELLYDSLIKTEVAVDVTEGMLSELKFKKGVMESKVAKGFTTATEIADLLVRKFGIPFRVAHRMVARLVKSSSQETFEPKSGDLVEIAKEFGYEIAINDDDLKMDVERILESRKMVGGTALEEIERMIEERKRRVEEWRKKVGEMKRDISSKVMKMFKICEEIGVPLDWDYWEMVSRQDP